MSFSEKLAELEALGVQIAQARHRIGMLEIERATRDAVQAEPSLDARIQRIDRKLLAERLDLHLCECRRDTLRLELSWLIADRNAAGLLDLADAEDLAR